MRSLMKACPVLVHTGTPPSPDTMSTVFQVSRGSCTMRSPGMLLQERRRQQPHDVVTLDEAAALVEQEAAVEVAVPRNAEVGLVPDHRLDGGDAVLLEQRVRYAVREVAVRRVVHLDEFEGQLRLQRVDDRAGTAVAGVHHDLQRLQRGAIHIAQQVLDVARARIEALQAAARAGRRERVLLGQVLDLEQPRVAADRTRTLAHELHAVVVLRVVAGGDHDAAVDTLVEGGEVDLLGAALTDVEHVGTGVAQALDQRGADLALLRRMSWPTITRRGFTTAA
jgi:hypothetical protein